MKLPLVLATLALVLAHPTLAFAQGSPSDLDPVALEEVAQPDDPAPEEAAPPEAQGSEDLVAAEQEAPPEVASDSNPALAPAPGAPRVGPRLPPPERRGKAPFQRDHYRFPDMKLFPRVFVDVIAIPLAPVGWTPEQWAVSTAVVGTTGWLMLPAGPSVDVRFQDQVRTWENPTVDQLLRKISTWNAAYFTLGVIGVSWLAAAVTQDPAAWELASLTTEAIGLAQFYHVSQKIALGREGPNQNDRQGVIHGPTVEFFPAGTPSGHAANVAVIAGTFAEYYDRWWLRAGAFSLTTYFSASLVYHSQHYISDVIWGAALGYSTARWVVRNRSSKYRYGPSGIERVDGARYARKDERRTFTLRRSSDAVHSDRESADAERESAGTDRASMQVAFDHEPGARGDTAAGASLSDTMWLPFLTPSAVGVMWMGTF